MPVRCAQISVSGVAPVRRGLGPADDEPMPAARAGRFGPGELLDVGVAVGAVHAGISGRLQSGPGGVGGRYFLHASHDR